MPEGILLSVFLTGLALDLLLKKSNPVFYFKIFGYTVCLIALYIQWQDLASQGLVSGLMSGMLRYNSFLAFVKILVLLSGIVTLLFFRLSGEYEQLSSKADLMNLLTAMLLSLSLLLMSANYLMFYVALELTAICSYVLIAFSTVKKGAEAAMKYILYGALVSGLMLYGISLLYGFTGSLDFSLSASVLSGADQPIYIILPVLILVLAGLLFKVSGFPFHIWTPDVYEGGPPSIVAFISVAPKIVGLVLFVVMVSPWVMIPLSGDLLLKTLLIVSFTTIAVGNFSALLQSNARRMLAYSSIAHAGFIMAGLFSFNNLINSVLVYYLPVYLLMNFAAFFLVAFFAERAGGEDVNKFKGLGYKYPYMAVIFVIVMIALTGLPPTAGFYAKLFVFTAVWQAYIQTGEQWYLFLFIFGLGNIVISLFYYLKIPYFMFFKKPLNDNMAILHSKAAYIFVTLLCVPLILTFISPDVLIELIKKLRMHII